MTTRKPDRGGAVHSPRTWTKGERLVILAVTIPLPRLSNLVMGRERPQ